ncbi:hypothetical protein HK104_004142 [Borealophlyctis nickersoniae]|nr:hypothetical protein HK104_004142 [Borealophlyctis nickersoniae]
MRFFRPLLQAAQAPKLKATTNLHGLPVHPEPIPHLTSLYRRIIHHISRLPSDSIYAQSANAVARARLDIVEKHKPEIKTIEELINAGEIEELIEQAEDELNLIPIMEKYKPWEQLEVPAPPGQWEYFGKPSQQ